VMPLTLRQYHHPQHLHRPVSIAHAHFCPVLPPTLEQLVREAHDKWDFTLGVGEVPRFVNRSNHNHGLLKTDEEFFMAAGDSQRPA